jgi:uncharacterized repeat protein (TIGR02543 family)
MTKGNFGVLFSGGFNMTHVFKTGRKFAVVLVLAFAVAFAGFALFAKTVNAAESGDGWTLSDDGLLTITSSTAFSNDKWTKEDVKQVVVGSGITEIPQYGLDGLKNLESVTLGSDVVTIGYGAFEGNQKLVSINLENVTSVGDRAFEFCKSLTAANLSPNATTIGFNAFFECNSLASVSIGKVSSIGITAFGRCYALTSIDLSYVTFMDYQAFEDCTSLETVTLGSGLKEIKQNTFTGCTSLTTINLGNIETIGYSAFYDCEALTNVDLSKVKTIGTGAFQRCYGITSLNLSKLESVEDSVFSDCKNLVSVTLGDSCTSIGNRAFYNCRSMESINTEKIVTVDDDAFLMCDALKSVDLSSCESIGISAFSNCISLKSVTLGADITEIKFMTFYKCTRLEDINLGNVTKVNDDAFNGAESLKNVDLSKCTSVGDSAFSRCTTMTAINLSNVTSIGYAAFSGCSGLTTVTSTAKVTDIDKYAFKNCSGLTSLDLSKAYAIDEECCRGCTSLVSVDLSSAENIGKNAFYQCSNLETVILGNADLYLEDYAFSMCDNLSSIDLSHATNIGAGCFYSCDALVTADLSSVTTLGGSAFNGCTGLTTVTLAEDLTGIPNYAFDGCTKLSSINFPNVITIGKCAFRNCKGLTSIDLKYTSVISEGAFKGCTNLTDLTLGYKLGYMITAASDPSLLSFEYDKLVTVYFFGPKRLFEQHGIANYFPNATVTYGGAYDVFYYNGTNADIRVIEEGNQAPVLPDPQGPSGSVFIGWFTDKDFKNAYDFSLPVTNDVTLYAGWIRDISRDVFKGYTLSLGGDIGVNFYTLMPEDVVGDRDYIEFSIDDIEKTQTIYVKDARKVVKDGVTYYVFDCQVPAKNMTSTVYADFYMNGQRVGRNHYSVKNYANYILMNQTYFSDAVPLVTAMLNYGAYAQLYFGYKTDDLANKNLYNGDYDFDSVTASMINRPYDSSKTILPAGLTAASASMVLESNTTLKIYFTDNTNKKLTFKLVDGDREITLKPAVSRGQKVIRITGISADRLNDDFKIKVYVEGDSNEYSFTYSPMTYAYNILNREPDAVRTEELKNLMKAFYLYNQAAKAYQNI